MCIRRIKAVTADYDRCPRKNTPNTPIRKYNVQKIIMDIE